MSPVLSPVLGATVDKYGKRTYLSSFYIVLLSTFSCLIAHIQYFLMPDCEECLESIMPMIYLQVGYSIYCAVLWSAIPYTVPEYTVVTSFGLTSSCLNLSLAVSPILLGLIHSKTGEYKFISLFFIIVAVMGLVSGTWLHLRNLESNNILNTPELKQEEMSKEDTCDEEQDTSEESELLKRG
jgi:MFS family permease